MTIRNFSNGYVDITSPTGFHFGLEQLYFSIYITNIRKVLFASFIDIMVLYFLYVHGNNGVGGSSYNIKLT